MILSTLTDRRRIEPLHPLFGRFFDYIQTHDLLHAPLGRIDIEGDDLFVNNVEAQLVEAERQVLEAHRAYIDIHVVLQGCERIGWLPIGRCRDTRQAFDPAADCALFADTPASWATLGPGDFAVVFPEDAHAPVVGQGTVRKLIGKIRL